MDPRVIAVFVMMGGMITGFAGKVSIGTKERVRKMKENIPVRSANEP